MEESWKNVVWQAKPELRNLLEQHGSTSVSDYFSRAAGSAYSGNERDEELLQALREETERLFGPEIAARVVDALKKQWMVSTADHHGPLCHPFFLNANLAQAAANRERGLSAVIVLACAGISLNNSSFPRGIFAYDALGKEQRLHFVSLKHRHHPVFGFPAYTGKDMEFVQNEIDVQFEEEDGARLHSILGSTFGAEEALKFRLYADQCSWGNYALWKNIPGEEKTDLVYLQQEIIAANLLIDHHLLKDTAITRLLLDPEWRLEFERLFEGIQGAFSADGKGTVFFWLLHQGKRVPLALHGNELIAVGARWSISLEPDSIRSALLRKEIFPGMALTFIVLAFYYGLECGGGFSQINYLGDIKRAWLQLLQTFNDPEAEVLAARNIATNVFRGELVLGEKVARPVSSIDLVLKNDPAFLAKLRSLTSALTMADAISAMMPEYYKIIAGHYPEEGF